MNRKLKLYGIAAGLLAVGTMVSCTAENGEIYPAQNSGNGFNLVHTPDVTAWSGSQTLGAINSKSSKATAGNSEFFEVTEESIEWPAQKLNAWDPAGPGSLMSYLSNGYGYNDEYYKWQTVPALLPDGSNNSANLDTDFVIVGNEGLEFRFLPCVTGQTDQTHKVIGLFYYDSTGKIHEQDIWTFDASDVYDAESNTIKCVKIKLNADIKFGFYFSGRTANSNDDDITYYTLSDLNESVAQNREDAVQDSYIHAGLVRKTDLPPVFKGSTVIGLEDWTDFDYNDFLIFVPDVELETTTPDDKVNDTITPGDDEGDEGDEGDDNPGGDEGDDNPGKDDEPEKDGDNENVVSVYHNSEVEINYSINDVHMNGDKPKYDNADLWTKLSIHVRVGGDVKVHIPLPELYVCESDDLVILQDHMKYTADQLPRPEGSYVDKIVYNIEDWTVTLTVDLNDNGITVTTDGITQELIDYLFEKNGDGINFEIWNYFQTETVNKLNEVIGTLTEEQYGAFGDYLNQSTVEFLGAEYPDYYINAFNEFDGVKHPGDRTVTPLEGQSHRWKDKKDDMFHLNKGSYNVIYYYVDEADDLHAHGANDGHEH